MYTNIQAYTQISENIQKNLEYKQISKHIHDISTNLKFLLIFY